MSDGGNGENGGADENGARGGSGNGARDGSDDEPSTSEQVVAAISVAFTVLLFAFVAWQGLSTPAGAHPAAQVIGTATQPDGDVVATVELTNRGDVGLLRTMVEIDCTDPPTEVEFENVPADGREVVHVTCPPGTGRPNVSVAFWVEA